MMADSTEPTPDPTAEGQASYQGWRTGLRTDPEYDTTYVEEAAKSELWLQLVEARQAAGLSQADLARRLGVSEAHVKRIENRGYDLCTLTTLRRYVAALGDGFSLVVEVRRPEPAMAPAST
jgi:ribosome-binding protein aMBF1 (putative translation factor)